MLSAFDLHEFTVTSFCTTVVGVNALSFATRFMVSSKFSVFVLNNTENGTFGTFSQPQEITTMLLLVQSLL